MNTLAYAAAFASLSIAGTAQAQDAAKAFQCDLPYRDTMMAMGSLEVLSQTPVKPFPGLHGEGEMIEFAPGDTSVFGIKPEGLNLKVLPPHPLINVQRQYTIVFSAKFAMAPTNDEKIRQSVEWGLGGCTALETCYRAEKARPEGGGVLKYQRLPLAESSAEYEPKIECTFSFSEEEFEAIGN
ncbi:MAG: hypothetical protein HLUCCX21_03380 [Porphyrobacter sp. HL-46]|nr:MAG: hypothetical protein HLUCCX21_03380 [Porphyrobacter sp. HL-46]